MLLYKQTTKFTCGPACALMILHHYFPQKFPLDRENELRLWLKSVRSPVKGTSHYAIALLLHKEDFKIKVYIGKIKFSSLFWRQYKELGVTKKDMELASIIEDFYYKDAVRDGVYIKKVNLKFRDIEEFIQKSNLVILRVNMKVLNAKLKNLTHYIIVSEKRDSKFHIYDPYNGEYWLKRKKLEKAFVTVKTVCGEDNRAITVGQ